MSAFINFLLLLQKSEDKARREGVTANKVLKGRVRKDGKRKRKRGLVYLSHIPHGFYEVSKWNKLGL